MAESTRFRTIEDQLKKQDMGQARIQELLEGLIRNQQNMDARIETNDKKIDEQIATVESKMLTFMKAMANHERRVTGEDSDQPVDKTPLLPNPNEKFTDDMDSSWNRGDRFGRQGWQKGPKVELPMFQGDSPREWIRKCRKYFLIYQVPEDQQMNVVEMHLEGKAEIWYQSTKLAKGQIFWAEFCADVIRRFGDRGVMDEVEEFNKLQQSETIRDYQERFEELRSGILLMNPKLTESYFISSFISGVKEEIKPMLRLMKPTSLLEAFEIAVIQEQSVEVMYRRNKVLIKPWPDRPKTPSHSSQPAKIGENATEKRKQIP